MTFLTGDALTILKTLNDESVNCIITSPPYWGLRDYKTAGQIGAEATFQEYIDSLAGIFDQCKRILKSDGTCWIVIGDTYPSGGGLANEQSFKRKAGIDTGSNPDYPGKSKLRHSMGKSLLMLPQRLAIRMIDNGWLLRNDIIWHKPNGLPNSALDRFTNNYEHILFFTKSKKYYFETQFESKRIMRSIWTVKPEASEYGHFAVFPEELIETPIMAGCPEGGTVLDPFCGTGTTCYVAERLRRKWMGIDINPDYIEMSKKRLSKITEQIRMSSFFCDDRNW